MSKSWVVTYAATHGAGKLVEAVIGPSLSDRGVEKLSSTSLNECSLPRFICR